MKSVKVIVSMLMITGLLSSCVSSKKYNEEVYQRNKLQDEYNALQTSDANLKAQYDNMSSSKEQELSLKEKDLLAKENALKERERKVQELTSDLKAEKDAIANLKQEVCSALKCFTPDELSVEVRDGKLYVSMSDKLLFPSGSDVVNKRGEEAIQMLAAVLNNSNLEIMVEGHTDAVPINTERNKDNWDLSVHRATSVTRIFVKDGVAPTRIIAAGRSQYHPVAANDDEDGRKLNRRTEIVLAPKLDKLWKLTEGGDDSSAMNK